MIWSRNTGDRRLIEKIEIKKPKIRLEKSMKFREIDPKVSGRSMSRLWRHQVRDYRTEQNGKFLQTTVQSEKFRRRNKGKLVFFCWKYQFKDPERGWDKSLSRKIGIVLVNMNKESSLIGKTLHCGCKIMGSNPISRWVRSLIGKTIVCGAVNTGSNPVEPLAV
jgi:hypothetical protein